MGTSINDVRFVWGGQAKWDKIGRSFVKIGHPLILVFLQRSAFVFKKKIRKVLTKISCKKGILFCPLKPNLMTIGTFADKSVKIGGKSCKFWKPPTYIKCICIWIYWGGGRSEVQIKTS